MSYDENDDGIVSPAPAVARMLIDAAPEQAADADALQDRARGTMLGLAAGNLLGLPVEGWWYDDIESAFPGGLRDINPAEKFRDMDDDLAQAVDLAESLLDGGDEDELVEEFTRRLVKWRHDNGRGCGYTTSEVVWRLERGDGVPHAASEVYEMRGGIAPNGGLMRCAPVALARLRQPDHLISDTAATCVVTHYAPSCQWSCVILNSAIALLAQGTRPDLPALYRAAIADGAPDLAAIAREDGIPTAAFDAIAGGEQMPDGADWLRVDHVLIGHTLLALQVGLWAVETPLGFEDALVAAAGGGGDADTNAAVAGAVLGARYGASAIPARWLECIPQRQRIEGLADDLIAG